ncbi:MAG: AIPR family protein [Thermosipho sp. (in: Bacteria)]|nr:AIPR family protein [Thermosipho sp. (in: thermotogales)]
MCDNNTIILDGCIKQFKDDNMLPSRDDDEIFELFTAFQITKEIGLDITEIDDGLVDGPNDGGIDYFIILVNDQCIFTTEEVGDIDFTRESRVKLILIQSKKAKSFKEDVIDKIYYSSKIIFDLSIDEKELLEVFNEKLVDKILTFRKVWFEAARCSAKISIEIYYVSRGNTTNINNVLRLKSDQVIELIKENVIGSNVSFQFLGSKELLEIYRKPPKTQLSLTFKENPIPITYISERDIGFIGVVSLKDYFNFITDEKGEIIEEIFESNIRHFQGNVDVNKKIANTLANDEKRDFWWLNNGITIIASGYSQFPKMLHLEDVQIVNGLQTSYVIYDYFKGNDSASDQRALLVKVIISTDKETIDKIISATNSQNPVSPSLLRATDDIQRDLEIYFLNNGYYYDRRKNYYKNQDKPARKIFSIQSLSQYIQAILNFDPASARSKPTSLIKDDKSYNAIFNSEVDFGAYLNCCLIYQRVDDYIKTQIDDSETRSRMKNFSLHLARILTSVITGKSKYTSDDVKSIKIDAIKDEHLIETLNLLLKAINQYSKVNPSENIINIAKSKKFVKMLQGFLDAYFDSKSKVAISKEE